MACLSTRFISDRCVAPVTPLTYLHPTRLIIALDAIRHNLALIRRATGPRPRILAVVKANAYGHGALQVARTALEAGAAWCGVATLPEAIALRVGGIRAPILVLGFTPGALAREVIAHDLRVNVYDLAVAREFARAARAADTVIKAHVKLDTGMGRLGVTPAGARGFLETLQTLDGLVVEGAFTHFSSSESDPEKTREQNRLFIEATHGFTLLRHACNSAGTLGFPEAHHDMVRPGLALYGMSPWAPDAPPPQIEALVGQLRPALRWRSEIASLKTLPDGALVGYNGRYRCDGERRVAVIPVGYGDGMRRTPSNAGHVLVRGVRAPILGTVCMDQCMLDVTHIPDATLGDEVVLLGSQGAERLTADEIAARTGTINYEVTTALLARAERVYL